MLYGHEDAWSFSLAGLPAADLPGSCLAAVQTSAGPAARSTEFAARRACRTYLPALTR